MYGFSTVILKQYRALHFSFTICQPRIPLPKVCLFLLNGGVFKLFHHALEISNWAIYKFLDHF